eukprot:1184863-Prorocentrum_minimum.AAC.3
MLRARLPIGTDCFTAPAANPGKMLRLPLDALHTANLTEPSKEEKCDEVKVEDVRGTVAAPLVTVPAIRFCHALAGRVDTTWRVTALIAIAASFLTDETMMNDQAMYP